MLAGFFVTAAIARHFGPEDFGAFQYAVAFFGFFEIFISVVHSSIVKKWLIEKKELVPTIMGSTAVGFLFVWMATSVVLMTLLWAFDLEIGVKRQILSLLSIGFFFRIFDVLVFWFDANLLSGYHGRIDIFSVISFSVLRVAIIALNLGIIYLALSMVIQAFLNFILMYLVFRKMGPPLKTWKFSWSILRSLVFGSFVLTLTAFSAVIYNKIDQVMLSHVAGDVSVGLYSAAIKLCEPWLIVSSIVIQVVFGALLGGKTAGSNPQLYRLRFMKVLSLLTWTAIGISIFYYFTAGFLVTLVFSSAYSSATQIIHILIWAILFQFWASAQSAWDVAENLTIFTFLRTFVAALINISLNLLLIPKYGGQGAAIATVAAVGLSNLLVNLMHTRTREFLKMQLESFLFWKSLPHQKLAE